MGNTYVGDECEVGFNQFNQCFNVARMTRTHLHNGHFVFGFKT